MRTKILILSVSVLLLIGNAWLAWNVDWAVGLRRDNINDPAAQHQITRGTDGKPVTMTEEDILREIIAPADSVGAFRHYLVTHEDLYQVEYVLLGIVGACVGIWLALYRAGRGPATADLDLFTTAVGILLSAAAGYISYLLVRWGTSIGGGDYGTTMEKWKLLPVLAGAFNTTFYDALPRILTNLVSRLTPSAAPTTPPDGEPK